MESSAEWVGYCAAVLTTGSYLPQALKVLRTRDTHSISLGMYCMMTVGIAFWLAYGFVLGSVPMALANSITLILCVTILIMKVRLG